MRALARTGSRVPLVMAMAIALGMAGCGDDALTAATSAPNETTTSVQPSSALPEVDTTATSTPPTTAVAATTTQATTTTTTTLPPEAPPEEVILAEDGEIVVYGTQETIEITNGSITLMRPRLEIPYDPAGAAEVQAGIDGYFDEIVADFMEFDSLNPWDWPNEFDVVPEVTLLHTYYLSIRFDEYYGIAAAAHPFSALTGFMWETNGNRLVPADFILDIDGPNGLLARMRQRVNDEIGDAFGADIHLADMVLTPTGIEVAVDESDGLPHVLGRVIVAFAWEDIADILDEGRLWWLIPSGDVDP